MGSPPPSLQGRRRTQSAGGPYAKRVVELDVLAGLEPGLFDERERLELRYVRAIARAPEPDCPNTDGWWVRAPQTRVNPSRKKPPSPRRV